MKNIDAGYNRPVTGGPMPKPPVVKPPMVKDPGYYRPLKPSVPQLPNETGGKFNPNLGGARDAFNVAPKPVGPRPVNPMLDAMKRRLGGV